MKKRVKIPTNRPQQLLDLAKKVQEKHLADGDDSILKMFNWQELHAVIEEGVQANDNALRLKREMLQNFQKRDLRMVTITDFLRDSRDILSGAFKKEMKILGQWGYEVAEVRNTKNDIESASNSHSLQQSAS